MKKFIVLISMILCMAFMLCLLSGCNKQIFDTTYKFNKAIISLPDGSVIKGTVESWKDFEDGDQIQVKIDGKTYLVHSVNICLISE